MIQVVCRGILLLCIMLRCCFAEAFTTELRVLVDTSGSMHHADPLQIRKYVVEALPEMLLEKMEVGVWAFSDEVHLLIEPAPIDMLFQKTVSTAAEQITDFGLGSDLRQAMLSAIESWRTENNKGNRILVLLTDGGIDISARASDNRVSRDYLMKEMIPELQRLGVQVVSLAFSEKADNALLMRFASETKGRFERVGTREKAIAMLRETLQTMIRDAHYLNQKHLFTVMAQNKQITLFIKSTEDTLVQLRLPNGSIINKNVKKSNIRWFEKGRTALITIQNPMPGDWELLAHIGREAPYLLYKDLHLEISAIPKKVIVGEAFNVSVRLFDEQAPVLDRGFLEMLQVTATLQNERDAEVFMLHDDASSSNVYQKDGSFALKVPILQKAGNNGLTVRAFTPTFEFEHSSGFVVYQTPARIMQKLERQNEDFSHYRITIDPEEGLVDPNATQLQISLQMDEEKPRVFKPLFSNNQWSFVTTVSHDTRWLKIESDLEGKLIDGRSFSRELTPLLIENTFTPVAPSTTKKVGLDFAQKLQREKSGNLFKQELIKEVILEQQQSERAIWAWLLLAIITLIECILLRSYQKFLRVKKERIRGVVDVLLSKMDVSFRASPEGIAK